VLVLADHHFAFFRQLVELAFDHAQGNVAKLTNDIKPVWGERKAHRFDVQVVPKQHSDIAAPP
jgi:hypothetical protein